MSKLPNDADNDDETIRDVAIIGAGISGINTAYRLQEANPKCNYTLYESRHVIGGTWSFFKYPGLRSDSDLFSFGFEWNPWQSDRVIADAASILEYLQSSIKSTGIDKRIVYQYKLISGNWSTKQQLWTLKFSTPGKREAIVKARWIVLGTGYYSYEQALPADIPGLESFKGEVVHPQFWPEKLDLTDKRVALIGSGATAITILPNIVDQARQITLVQRSPSYIGALPLVDSNADFLKRWLPLSWAMRILRFKYLLLSFLFFNFCQRFPKAARKSITANTEKELPPSISVNPHFTPTYGPWDQRFCFCPDGDFYSALRTGKVNMVTGHIQSITDDTIKIKDQPDSAFEADVIITATGLKLLIGGGAKFSVNGSAVHLPDKMMWKGCMLQDVPNALAVIGYTNASWTLGADVAAKTLTRVMRYQDQKNLLSATPTLLNKEDIQQSSFMKMSSTYLTKGRGDIPKAGDKYPWLPRASYFSDMWDAAQGDIRRDMVFA